MMACSIHPYQRAVEYLQDMLGSGEAARNLLQKYFQHWDKVKADLLAACLGGDFSQLRQLLHLMKGRAGNLGLVGMSQAADAVLQAKERDDGLIVLQLIQILELGDACQQQLQEKAPN